MSDGGVVVRFGAYELIVGAQELWRDGRRVRVPPQAVRILIELTTVPGVIVSRERLCAALWPDGTYVDFERSLNTAVRKLRAALDDEADRPRYLQTVPGRGYRFIAPVTASISASALAPVVAPVVAHADAPVTASVIAAGRLRAARPRSAAGAATSGRLPEISPIRLAIAIALLCTIAATLLVPRDRSRPLWIVVRADAAGAALASSSDDRVLLEATVASLQAIVGRLSPSRLVVTGGAPQPHTGRVCHELVASAHGFQAATRVSVRLIDRCRDEQLWATIADVPARGAVDDAAVRAAGRAVADRLLDAGRSAREAAATTSGPALDAYRRGQAATRAARIEDLVHAVAAFEEATRRDPQFAPAWAGLARARATGAIRDGRDPRSLQLARAEAERALAFDRDLADAHIALGQVRFALDRDFDGAETWFRRARALGATEGQDLLWLACALHAQGEFDEALRILDEAVTRAPRVAVLHAWRGLLLHAVHRYDEEIATLQRAAAIDDQSAEAFFHLGLGYARRRQYDRALPALNRAVLLSRQGGFYLSWLGRVAADSGDLETAERTLADLDAIARTRGLHPELSRAVAHHIETKRHRSPAGSL